MNPCNLATDFAVRLMKARDLPELASISSEVRARLRDLTGWEDWLRDIWTSRNTDLKGPYIPFEDTLNAAGRRALKKGLLYATNPEPTDLGVS
jgi:hypothetical protein